MMDNSFFAYIQELELIAFFSGYPLVYAFILFIGGDLPLKNDFKSRLVHLLPFGYALAGTLYLGLQLRNLYPDYSFENIHQSVQNPYLTIWGLLSIFFWIPAPGKRPAFSLMHSLVIFYLLLKNIFIQLTAVSTDMDVVRNDMKIYTISLLLNLGSFALIVLLSILYTRFIKRAASPENTLF
ncbi:MAG: hypothetical protein WC220_11705 [Pedobacter sp.]|jgi:hypothetical protein